MTAYAEFDCQINTASIDELFRRYQEIGFLYPEKLRRLEPYLDVIKENWRRVLSADRRLMKVVTFAPSQQPVWASITNWRSTHRGWCAQHLVSTGNPLASRSVMLAEQLDIISDSINHSNCNWFRPENRMPNRMFGSIEASLGVKNCSVQQFSLCEVTPEIKKRERSRIDVSQFTNNDQGEFCKFVEDVRGPVYVQAEELDSGDIELSELDKEYQAVALRRYRQVWVARDGETGELIGSAIAHRGPLGLNFSFLENRTDLLVQPQLSTDLQRDVIAQLLSAVSSEYLDFAPGKIPVIADEETSGTLEKMGHQIVRSYKRSIWLKRAYGDWYDHIDQFYERIRRHLQRCESKTLNSKVLVTR